MTLKEFTHKTFPYLVLIIIGVAMISTFLLDEPLGLLQDILAAERYWWSLSVYFVLIIVGIIVMPLSVAPVVPFMAKIFGPFAVFAVTWAGWVAGSAAVYYITRRWGQRLVGKLFSIEKLQEFETRMPNHMDFWLLLLLRTFIPVDILSYAVGLFTKISFGKYMLATAVGIVPFAFILSYGPDALVGNNPWLLFVFLVLLFVMLTSLAVFYFSSWFKEHATIYTHDGKFHTDDVFAVAAIATILEQSKTPYSIVRTRDEQILEKAKQSARDGKQVFVIDVGEEHESEYNLFDHHQNEEMGTHINGMPWASFGLVWQEYGERLSGSKDVAVYMDETFVSAIDGPDNGVLLLDNKYPAIPPLDLHAIVEDLYRTADVTDIVNIDADFKNAVIWAQLMTKRMIERSRGYIEKNETAGRIYAQSVDKEIIVTDEYVGKDHFVRFSETKMIVSPRNGNADLGWSVVVVPTEFGGVEGRVRFPESWWGLHDEELKAASGVVGAEFCHKSGNFICTASSQKSAIDMARITLEQHNQKDKG